MTAGMSRDRRDVKFYGYRVICFIGAARARKTAATI